MSEVKFNEKTYTEEVLKSMELDSLLELRNSVADALGVANLKSFKDKNQAVSATWKALEKFNTTGAEPKPAGKAAKKPKEPKAPAEPAKCGFGQHVKRPTRGMFRTIKKIAEHPGKGHRIRRWENYKDGMTLLEIAEGDNMDPLDIGYYVGEKLMSVSDCTDEEFKAGLDEWYKKHGLKNPAEQKAILAKERAEAKAKKDKERAEAKEEAAKKKASVAAAKKLAADKKAADKAEAAKKKAADAAAKKAEADKK